MRVAFLVVTVAVGCGFHAPLSGGGTDAASLPDDAPLPDGAIDAPTPSACPQTYTLSDGASRYRFGTAASWYDAQRSCEADGTHLVVIESAAENTFVLAQQVSGDLWIGMSDHLTEDTFRWVTGVAVTGGPYENWQSAPSQPNDGGGSEDCGEMNAGGVWNDNPCATVQRYLCECDGAALTAETWCETGTDRSCDRCDDRCDQAFDGDGACIPSNQTCVEGD